MLNEHNLDPNPFQVTRSDVLGHILPNLGKDWSHAGTWIGVRVWIRVKVRIRGGQGGRGSDGVGNARFGVRIEVNVTTAL